MFMNYEPHSIPLKALNVALLEKGDNHGDFSASW
jgi:hypothetical protein